MPSSPPRIAEPEPAAARRAAPPPVDGGGDRLDYDGPAWTPRALAKVLPLEAAVVELVDRREPIP